jgi:ferrous iron transport protein B
MTSLTAFFIGLPNAGKSTLFNALTGKSRKVSNYSGITTDLAQAQMKIRDESITIVDLPGITSLSPLSPDEGVTISTLFNCYPHVHANLIFFVIDLKRLTPSLSLCLEVIEQFSGQVIGLINKDDDTELGSEQRNFFAEKLGCPIVCLSSLNQSPDIIKVALSSVLKKEEVALKKGLSPNSVQVISSASLPFLDALTNHEGKAIFAVEEKEDEVFNKVLRNTQRAREIVIKGLSKERKALSHKVDAILLNNWLGPLIFLAIFLFIFTALFSWATPFMDGIDGTVSAFSAALSPLITNDMLKSLVIDGVIGGVGGVIIFLPQIMILSFEEA